MLLLIVNRDILEYRRKLHDNKQSLVLMSKLHGSESEILEGMRPSEVRVCLAGCACMWMHACFHCWLTKVLHELCTLFVCLSLCLSVCVCICMRVHAEGAQGW